mmetsp:Transcript_18639/g.31181  ORF Transcript_18639/g.31181 Transcript_18639/m.31181 type:complete len:205 (-) Transcript_18639:1150-1764(-)
MFMWFARWPIRGLPGQASQTLLANGRRHFSVASQMSVTSLYASTRVPAPPSKHWLGGCACTSFIQIMNGPWHCDLLQQHSSAVVPIGLTKQVKAHVTVLLVIFTTHVVCVVLIAPGLSSIIPKLLLRRLRIHSHRDKLLQSLQFPFEYGGQDAESVLGKSLLIHCHNFLFLGNDFTSRLPVHDHVTHCPVDVRTCEHAKIAEHV